MSTEKLPIGSSVTFLPGPRSASEVTAEVTGHDGSFLVTVDPAGKERKIRAGAARAA